MRLLLSKTHPNEREEGRGKRGEGRGRRGGGVEGCVLQQRKGFIEAEGAACCLCDERETERERDHIT